MASNKVEDDSRDLEEVFVTMELAEIAFMTDKVVEMTAFYRKFLGREPDSVWPGGAIFMLGDVKLFIHAIYEPDSENSLPPIDHIAFRVKDVDGSAARLAAEGLPFEFAPADYDWGRSAYLRDPADHQIEITG